MRSAALDRVLGWSAGTWPFEIAMLLDFEQGMTDAIVTSGGQAFLLEMIDWSGPRLAWRIFRVAAVPDAVWREFERNLERGSCDLSRAGQELHAMASQCQLLPALIAADVNERRLLAVRELAPGMRPPTGSWRDGLPNDDTWFAALSLCKSRPGQPAGSLPDPDSRG